MTIDQVSRRTRRLLLYSESLFTAQYVLDRGSDKSLYNKANELKRLLTLDTAKVEVLERSSDDLLLASLMQH